MIAIIRIFLVIILSVFICTFGLIYCIFNPRNPRNVAVFSHLFSRMSVIFGIQLEMRYPKNIKLPDNCIYIANHQSNYDMITVSHAVQPRTITVGKKNLIWIPIFGLFYWLSGNLFINRKKNVRSQKKLISIARNIKKRNISIWIFPEGTRSLGRGLLPFKTGAFYTAIIANIPIVPICVSNVFDKIKLNRWNNGVVIIDILPPIDINGYNKNQVRVLTNFCWNIMNNKINELNKEIAMRELLNTSLNS